MKIREACEADLPIIVDIYNSTISGKMATADTELVSIESRVSWFREHSKESRPIFVMELEGKVIGWLSFQSFYGRPAYHATREISIYIAENYRHQGIGSQLLEYAITIAPELKIKTLLAFVFGHNDPSLKLLKKFGFQQWGYLPKIAELDGIERDLAILGLRIDL